MEKQTRTHKLTFRCNDELKSKIDYLTNKKSTSMSALLLEYVVLGVRNDMTIDELTKTENMVKLLKDLGFTEEQIFKKSNNI